MTNAAMFHFLEPVLMDLYNTRANTQDSAKLKQINKWINVLQNSPTPKQFKEILSSIKGL